MNDKKFKRMTKQRRVIMEELQKSKMHPTAEELHGMTQKLIPNISLGTVYRNLDILASEGHIRKLENGAGKARFDGDIDDHLHLRCIQCDYIEDIDYKLQPRLYSNLISRKRFEIIGQNFEFYGFCRNCKQ